MQDLFINDDASLHALAGTLSASRWLAIDTEFVRERTYYPEPCLLQLANEHTVACVDLLAVSELGPLAALLTDPDMVKVFHDASQDLELLYRLFGSVPGPIFDTQVAATLLGYGDQIGYAALAKKMLDVDLDKSHSRTDWRQRPLTDAQIRYAGDDVRYLREIYRRQHQTLHELNRLDWLEADFTAATDPKRYRPDPDSAWKRLKRMHTLKGAQLAIAGDLAAWREREAMESNRPRRWVLADDALLDMARRGPKSEADLKRMRGLNQAQIDRYGASWLACVRRGREIPREAWPKPEFRVRLGPSQEALVDAAMAIVKLCGHEHSVSPGSLASKRELEALIAGQSDDSPLLSGWRHQIVGSSIERFLHGKTCLSVRNGHLVQRKINGE